MLMFALGVIVGATVLAIALFALFIAGIDDDLRDQLDDAQNAHRVMKQATGEDQ